MAFFSRLLYKANYTPSAKRSKQKMYENTTPPLTWMTCLLIVIWRFFLDCFTKKTTHTKLKPKQTMSRFYNNMACSSRLLYKANYTPSAKRSEQKMFEKTTHPLTWMICLLYSNMALSS